MAALFVVNPSNPPSVMLVRRRPSTGSSTIVTEHNPNLIIVTDDVYGTFVDGFRSIVERAARATPSSCTRSPSTSAPPAGASAWSGCADDHVVDRHHRRPLRRAARRPRASATRPSPTTPRNLRFIDRMVADTRLVALNHTAGLSVPQQVQMALFAATELADTDDSYEDRCRAMLARRLELPLRRARHRARPRPVAGPGYYVELDLAWWARRRYGRRVRRSARRRGRLGRPRVRPGRHTAASSCSTAAASRSPASRSASPSPTCATTTTRELGARIVDRFDTYRRAWFGDGAAGRPREAPPTTVLPTETTTRSRREHDARARRQQSAEAVLTPPEPVAAVAVETADEKVPISAERTAELDQVAAAYMARITSLDATSPEFAAGHRRAPRHRRRRDARERPDVQPPARDARCGP